MTNATQHPALALIHEQVRSADKRFFVSADGAGPGVLLRSAAVVGAPLFRGGPVVGHPVSSVMIAAPVEPGRFPVAQLLGEFSDQ